MGGYEVIVMGTWDIVYGDDGDLIGCCDECVCGVGGSDDNDRVGDDDGAVDGTDKCGSDGAVFGSVEGRNIGYVEGYCRGESGRWDGGENDGCSDGLMYSVDVRDRVRGGGGSSEVEGVGNLGVMFIMDMEIFEWLVSGVGNSVGKASVGWSSGEEVVGGKGVKIRGAVGAIAVRKNLSVLLKSPSPLDVTGFDEVVWRVGIKTLMEACSTRT